jgi:hypothetical protein
MQGIAAIRQVDMIDVNAPTKLCNSTLFALWIGMALLLSVSGGGGGNRDNQPSALTPTARAQTASYLTDKYSATYDVVWVSIARITSVSLAGEIEVAALRPTPALNLPKLRCTGALTATASLRRMPLRCGSM